MLGQHSQWRSLSTATHLCHHNYTLVSNFWRPVPSAVGPGTAATSLTSAAYRDDSSPRTYGSTKNASYSTGRGNSGSSRSPGKSGRSWEQQQGRQQQPQQRQRRPMQQRLRQETADEDDWQGDGDDDATYDSGYQYPARPSKASIREALSGDALYGVAPVLAALTAGLRRPYALLIQEGLTGAARKDARALHEIQRLAEAAGAEIKTYSKHDLNMLSGNRPHQGLILDASLLPWRDMEQLPHVDDLPQRQQQATQEAAQQSQDSSTGGSSAGSRQGGSSQHPVWLALDEVMDPQNLGAMLRSAYCLGASGVLACSRNCAPLSPVVSKASAGAMELMPLHSCKSMPRTLAAAVRDGWTVVGAAAEAGAVPVSEFKVEGPTVLVMGNEGYGVRPLVKRLCTQLVQIEMTQDEGRRLQLVDSLNVSVATGILLHHMLSSAKAQ